MPDLDRAVRLRDDAQRRLKALTRGLIVAATVLAGAFAGLAAEKAPGRKATTSRAPRAERRTAAKLTLPATPRPRPAPSSVQSAVPAPAPVAPVQPPAATSAPPVATSGGS